VEPPTDIFEDAEEGEADEKKATDAELDKELDAAVKTIEKNFSTWSEYVEKEVNAFLSLVKQVAQSGVAGTYRVGKFVIPITFQFAKYVMENLYDKKYVFSFAIIGFMMGFTIPASRDAGKALANWVLRSTPIQALNTTVYTTSFGTMKMKPIEPTMPRTRSDEWRDAFTILKYTLYGALAGIPIGGLNNYLIDIIKDWSKSIQGKHDIPEAEVLQSVSELSLAVRTMVEQQKQPQAPPVPIEVKIDMTDFARAMLAEMQQLRASPQEIPRGPALPYGVNPVRLPQGRRMALTDDDLPRGRMALTDDDLLPQRRGERSREMLALPPPPKAQPQSKAAPKKKPARVQHFDDMEAEMEGHTDTGWQVDQLGRGKPKRKTKEVLNIPPPILEHFDVKNDPHFIRAPKHQPKK
jgi:hypothetical protein